MLAKGQQALSNRFARPSVNSWDGVNHRCGTQGCALLPDAVATFECARRAMYPGGDHVILVGEVIGFEIVAAPEPLAFIWAATEHSPAINRRPWPHLEMNRCRTS